MMGLGKPQQHAKFEIASFSRCTNIKENPKILGIPVLEYGLWRNFTVEKTWRGVFLVWSEKTGVIDGKSGDKSVDLTCLG